jgi:mono/diheme cytochrome c family protein
MHAIRSVASKDHRYQSLRDLLTPALRLAAAFLALEVAACGSGDAAARRPAGADSAAAEAPPGAAAVANGAQAYQRCVACHQLNGQGMPGAFPPLVGSEYATAANVAVPIRIVLHGLQGPITVKGVQYNSVMPAYGTGIVMSDEEVAAVLTYVRRSWGNSASAVTPADVAKERSAARSRTGPMTAEELRSLL